MSKFKALTAVLLLPCLSHVAQAQRAPILSQDEIAEIVVKSPRVVNDSPASSYATPATALRFDPLTELQSRGLAEGQSDVTVRGGLFENTGFKLGSVNIIDPQTGHYVGELPVDPSMMTAPEVAKGIDSAVAGFNSAIATVSYGIRRVSDGGQLLVGAGSDSLNYQSLRAGKVMQLASGNDFGIALSLARSEGDGSLAFGDHEFARANLQLQHATETAQSDVIFAYQDKFYGWPGAYTGFATLPETDDTQTTLLLLNQRRETAGGWLEYGAFYRRLVDDYDFDRTTSESGTPGSFEHETRVFGLGFQGRYESGRMALQYGAQFTSDELVSSTDLTNGTFDDRNYATLTLVPSVESDLGNGRTLLWRFGATVDYSNRDDDKVSPLFGVTLSTDDARGSTEYALEFAATSQVPGYTALKSGQSGLFGGNPNLGREKANQLSASVRRDTDDITWSATLFAREDDDLVDWTYATASPFARQANPVDIDVIGLEAYLIRNWDRFDLILGYTGIDKDADYGSASVDASFYALNFAKHRVTLAFAYRFTDALEVRVDNEYRNQEDNPLRNGDDSTYLASLSLVWSSAAQGFSAALVVDNATDSSFQTFPGTPASGRQISLNASYNW